MHMQVLALAIVTPTFLHFFCELSNDFVNIVAFSSIEGSVDFVDEFVDYCIYIDFANFRRIRGIDFFKMAVEKIFATGSVIRLVCHLDNVMFWVDRFD